MCYLYVNNYEDFEIRKFLRIAQKQLDDIKAEIRKHLIAAGIETDSPEKVAV